MTSINGTDGRFRPCKHTKTTMQLLIRSPFTIISAVGQNKQYRIIDHEFVPRNGHTIGLPTTSVFTDAQWASYDTDAMVQMIPSTNKGFSLINFAIELKDFRRLAQAFVNRRGLLAEILGADLKKIGRRPLAELSSAYLNYSFNWKPFVSDLQVIMRQLANTGQRLRDIWDRQGIPQTRHYTRIIDTSLNSDWSGFAAAQFVANDGDTDLVLRDRTQWAIEPVYHATMRFTYQAPGALGLLNKIDAWTDAFGLRLDASIIWNAIPFSFIIDWVIDVSGFLRRFASNNLGLQVTVEDFCSSVKYKAVGERYVQIAKNGFPATEANRLYYGTPLQIAVGSNAYYERRVGIPNLYSALKTSGLSTKEASLGAALLFASRRPHR